MTATPLRTSNSTWEKIRRNTEDTSTPTLAIDGVHELTESGLDAVSGGFETVEHGTLGSSPKDQQLDAVIAKAVGLALGNMNFF